MARYDNEGLEAVSYLTLRRVVGLLAVCLPVALVIWGSIIRGHLEIESSISDYYGLRTRDLFVGVLFAIAWFLFTYRGHGRADSIASDLGFAFTLVVALVPSTAGGWQGIVHFTAATALFLTMSYFALFIFTRSDGEVTPRKKVRNRIYVGCAAVMLTCLALIVIYFIFLQKTPIAGLKPVFWLETLELWAFGVSWFIKGRTLWKDVSGWDRSAPA